MVALSQTLPVFNGLSGISKPPQYIATPSLEQISKLSALEFTPSTAFLNESFYTRLEIPESLEIKNPRIFLISPILGPIDINESGLVETSCDTVLNSKNAKVVNRLTIRSLKPIPEKVMNIPTVFNFPVIIYDGEKPVAKSSINITNRKLNQEEHNFLNLIKDALKKKTTFEIEQTLASSKRKIKIYYNQSSTLGKAKAAFRELWGLLSKSKEERSHNYMLNMFNIDPNKSPQQLHQERQESRDYMNIEILDQDGNLEARFNGSGDYLDRLFGRWGAGITIRAWDGGYDSGSIGGGAGPIFNSAVELAEYALNNFAFISQKEFTPQFTAQKPEPSMSKLHEAKPGTKAMQRLTPLAA